MGVEFRTVEHAQGDPSGGGFGLSVAEHEVLLRLLTTAGLVAELPRRPGGAEGRGASSLPLPRAELAFSDGAWISPADAGAMAEGLQAFLESDGAVVAELAERFDWLEDDLRDFAEDWIAFNARASSLGGYRVL